MATYNVVTIGDEILREKAVLVRRFDARLHNMLDAMAETMYEFDGVGLAAPQIGISKQIVVIDVGDGLWVLINPKIVEKSGNVLGLEGCLSVPEKQGYVYRHKKFWCRPRTVMASRLSLRRRTILPVPVSMKLTT